VVHEYNPSTWEAEAEAGGLLVQGWVTQEKKKKQEEGGGRDEKDLVLKPALANSS
jgi:hypothetical protein